MHTRGGTNSEIRSILEYSLTEFEAELENFQSCNVEAMNLTRKLTKLLFQPQLPTSSYCTLLIISCFTIIINYYYYNYCLPPFELVYLWMNILCLFFTLLNNLVKAILCYIKKKNFEIRQP